GIVIQAFNLEAGIMRCELSDDEWGSIRPMLPNKARGVTQIRSCGIVLSTSVQADRQGPSMITRSPDWRTAANSRRYEPASPPALDTMRNSARAAASDTRSRTRAMMARGTRGLPLHLRAHGPYDVRRWRPRTLTP